MCEHGISILVHQNFKIQGTVHTWQVIDFGLDLESLHQPGSILSCKSLYYALANRAQTYLVSLTKPEQISRISCNGLVMI